MPSWTQPIDTGKFLNQERLLMQLSLVADRVALLLLDTWQWQESESY
jgi:hypothetical protein